MDDNQPNENPGFNVPRLEILSLKKVIDLTVRESESEVTVRERTGESEATLKLKIQHVWFFFKQILKREEDYGAQAIRLIQVLSYLGGVQRIDYGLVDPEYDGHYTYNYERKTIFNVLDLLVTYGLIQVKSKEKTNFSLQVFLPNDFWMSVIREENGKNPNLEIYLLRACFDIVEQGTYSTWIKNDHFKALSPSMLKHRQLIQQFKQFLMREYSDEQLTADILKKFEEVFGHLDHDSMELRSRHLKMMLESEDPDHKILLAKCQEARVIFDGERNCKNVKVWSLAKLIYDIGSQSQDIESRVIFYEESLCWYKMIYDHITYDMGLRDEFSNHYNLKNCVERTVNILIRLKKYEEIYDLFGELEGKLTNKLTQLFDFDYCLSSMIEFIETELKNPILKKPVLGELLRIAEFAFKMVLNSQRGTIKWMKKKLCIHFPRIAKNLIKCLIELDQFDQIFSVIQETDLVWTEFVQSVVKEKNWKNLRDIWSYIDEHLNAHFLILNTCIKNQDLKDNVKLQERLLNQSVNAIMPLCLSVSVAPLLDYYYSKFLYVTIVGKCLTELNQMHELRIFLNNLEKLLDMPENEESERYFTIPTIYPDNDSEEMIDFCAMIARRLTPMNGRVECLPVLEKTLQITKKFLNEGRSNGMRAPYEKTARKIIERCAVSPI